MATFLRSSAFKPRDKSPKPPVQNGTAADPAKPAKPTPCLSQGGDSMDPLRELEVHTEI